MREVIQRFSIGGVEVKRSDGYRAGKNRGIIGIRSDVFVDALLEQPIIGTAARIFALAKLVARDFLDCRVNFTPPVHGSGTFTLSKT